MRLLPILLLTLLLGACATAPKPVTDQSHQRWQQLKHQLSGFNDWHLRGRVALFIDDEVYNLGLDWQHQASRKVLTLEAALGQGMIRIRRLNGASELTTAEGERRVAEDAEALLLQVTGWDIPVAGLEYWIRGLPHPGSTATPVIDSDGRLAQLQQDGWQINYLEYGESRDGLPALPHRLYMKRGRVRIKIVIDQWQKAKPARPDDLFPNFPG